MTQTVEQPLFDMIAQTVNNLGFELVRLTMQSQPKTLEILIDRLDNERVSVKDCQIVSKNLSVLLDVEDIIKDQYYLTVSSAGLERPLNKIEDYIRFLGKEVKIKLKEKINESTRYRGKIIKVENSIISLGSKEEEILVNIPFDLIKNANLVMTDDMFRKLLNK